MRALHAILSFVLAGVSAANGDEGGQVPEVDFLEYLGSWQAEDEEWVLAAGWESDDVRSEADAQPEPEEKQRDE